MSTLLVRRALWLALFTFGALPACNCTDAKVDRCKGVTCAAPDACHTAGTCDAATGLCSTPPAVADGTSCSDGNKCNGDEVCTAGACAAKAGTAVSCNAPGTCQVAAGATCNPSTGACTYPNASDGTSCSDGNACNGAEVCTAGACGVQAGTAIACNAPPACHTATGATCDPANGQCSYPSLADGTSCSDGNACNGAEVCTAGACGVQAGTAIACNAPPACHTATGATCNPANGQCSYPSLADGTSCSDGNACNGTEVCTAGACGVQAGTAITCNAPPACHTATGATCNPANGQCSYPNLADGASCSDGNACNGTEVCSAGACVVQPGTAILCNAPPSCHTTTGATCNPASGQCSYPVAGDGSACSDGNPCTVGDTCHAGACTAGTAKVCTASDQCHVAGTCDPGTGNCSNPAVDDGTSCSDGNLCNGAESCQGGLCKPTPGGAVACDSPGTCQVTDGATCDPQTGDCTYPRAADGSACSFDGECAGLAGCASGVCSCLFGNVGVRLVGPGGAPVAGAKVTYGDETATTDEDGIAALQLVPGDQAVLQLSAKGFAASTLVLPVVPAASFGSTVYLIPRADPLAFYPYNDVRAHGRYTGQYPEPPYYPNGAVATYRDASFDLGGDSLVDGAGGYPTGNIDVDVTLTSLDPTGPQRIAAPGPFVGVQALPLAPQPQGPVPLQAVAMTEVDFFDADGPLLLASPMTLHLRIPATWQSYFTGGETPNGWLYDPAAGLWNERSDVQGEVVLSNSSDDSFPLDAAPGESVFEWRAVIPETGWWAVMLPLPDVSCVQVQVVRASTGAPVPQVAVHASGVDFTGQSAGRTGAAGEAACLQFALGKTVSITADDPFLAVGSPDGTATVVGGATAAACGAGTCQQAVIKVADTACVHGKVADGTGAPVAGATITVTAGKGFSARSAHATSAADGSYCVAAPTGTAVRLSAVDVSGAVARATLTTSAAAAACGGACNEVADLVPAPVAAQKICVKGRIWDFKDVDAGVPPRSPAVGQKVWVFELGGGTVQPSCPDSGDDPPVASWASGGASLLTSAVTQADGRFCVDVPAPAAQTGRQRAPLQPVQRNLVVVPGDCDIRRRGISDESQRGYCAVDPLTPSPGDPQRLCEIENCIDIGDFDYAFLYSGSGCVIDH